MINDILNKKTTNNDKNTYVETPTNQDYENVETNNENYSLNIYQLDNEKISQLYKSNYDRPKEINLLLLENKHHVSIKNLKSLLD